MMKNRTCGKCRKRMHDARHKSDRDQLKAEAAVNRDKFRLERRRAVAMVFDGRSSGKLRDIGRDGTSVKAILLKRARTSA